MIPSILFNAAIVAITAVCVGIGIKLDGFKKNFRYFTVLSNVLCAITSLCVIFAWIGGSLPLWAVLLKFVGTAAVSVTMLTVVLFLGPTSGEWKLLLTGAQLFLHLINPLLAIISLCVFESTDFGFPWVFLGLLPTVLYGVFYLCRVVVLPEDRRMEDFYGFNKNGKWMLSVGMMLLLTFAASVILWAL